MSWSQYLKRAVVSFTWVVLQDDEESIFYKALPAHDPTAIFKPLAVLFLRAVYSARHLECRHASCGGGRGESKMARIVHTNIS